MSKSVQKSKFNTLSVAGACAVLYSLVLCVIIALCGHLGMLEAERAADILPILMENHSGALTVGWLFMVAPLLFGAAGLGLYEAVRDAGPWTRVAVVAFSTAALFALLRNSMWLAMTYEMAPVYVEASETTQITLAAVGDTLLRSGAVFGDIIGALLASGAIVLFSIATLRTGVAPRWVSWFGFAVGVTALPVPLIPFVEEAMAIVMLSVPFLVVWMIGIGVSLIRRPAHAEAATRPAPSGA